MTSGTAPLPSGSAQIPSGSAQIRCQIRGVALLGALRALRHYRDDALRRLDPSLHHYLVDKVLINGWYPETDLLALLEVVAALRALPEEDVWQWMGERMAQTDLGGIFAFAMTPTEPTELLERLPTLWSLYRSAGGLHGEATGERTARIEVRDYPLISDTFCRLMAGYLAEALRVAGGQQVAVELDGEPEGENVAFRASW